MQTVQGNHLHLDNRATVVPVHLQMQEKRQKELWMMIRVSAVSELTPSLCKSYTVFVDTQRDGCVSPTPAPAAWLSTRPVI